jgi:hypothetical protein
VWNEPNIRTFWTGTLSQMAAMVHAVWQIRQHVDRGVKVIAPSMVTRLPYELQGIRKFYGLKVDGEPVWKYVDATTFSLYPPQYMHGRPAGPEDMLTMLRRVRAVLAKDHVSAGLPIWDSEINYGLPTGSQAGSPTPQIPDSRQVAYVMRTYLLSAAAGVPRVFWYAYDFHGEFANTFLTEASPAGPGTLTRAGRAFYRVQGWMNGTLMGVGRRRPCAPDRDGTYICVVHYSRGTGRVYWNPKHFAKVKTVRSATSWESESGAVHGLRGGKSLRVGQSPILVRSRH